MKNNLLIKGLFGLLACTVSAFAEVNYVRNIAMPDFFEGSPILSTSQSPIFGDGYRVPDTLSQHGYASLDVSTGTFGEQLSYPDFVLIPTSILAWVGQSSPGTYSISLTNRQILVFNVDRVEATAPVRLKKDGELFAPQNAYSVAALSLNPISLLADNSHYTVDPFTGETTERSLAGVDTATTRFMSYGADGLLYVLDYGNDRIATFDPNNNFAFLPLKSFALNPDPEILVANQQFAIGVNGSFYLADGQGGGSYYNSLGQYQGTFGLPTDPVLNPYTGASFINTDAEGNIFVYDSAKGLHQYQDTSIVPEPGTVALIGLGALALLFRRRVFVR